MHEERELARLKAEEQAREKQRAQDREGWERLIAVCERTLGVTLH